MKFKLESYHYGDLSYGKKADTRDIMPGRSTGHFGTGFYSLGHKEEDSNYANRQLWEIDLTKYKLYKPKSNSDADYLHSTLKMVNNLDKDSFSRYDEKQLVSQLDDLNYYSGNKGILKFIKLYEPEALNNDPDLTEAIKEGQWGYVEDYAKDLIHELVSSSDRLEVAESNLQRIFGIKPDKLEPILKEAVLSNSEDSASTLLMKALGYEGVDVSHLDHDGDGLRGFDNFEYGSVVYDLKPGTYRRLR